MVQKNLGPKDALRIVDVQNDFCVGGKLAVPHADEIIPQLNRWAEQAEQDGAMIVASRDCHPPEPMNFRSRFNWQGSEAIATDLRAIAWEARPQLHRHVAPALASASAEDFGISIAFSADDQALSTEGVLCR